MPENKYSSQVYVDLDALIMSKDCSPKFLEDNLGVPDNVLYDAIGYSVNANWLLKLDYLYGFSSEFRKRIFKCISAFSTIHKVYFLLQLNEVGNTGLLKEYRSVNVESRFEQTIQLYNPLNKLSNRWKETEHKLLDGSLNLHDMVISDIRTFMKSGEKDYIDFSHSLFLPEILSPKFFNEAEDCERTVILGMYETYVDTIRSFSKKRFANGGLSSGIVIRNELNPLVALVKHILSGDNDYSDKIRILAWRKLVSDFDKTISRAYHTYDAPQMLPIEGSKLDEKIDKSMKYANGLGYGYSDILKWVKESERAFEPFELDCTTHGLRTEEFIWVLVRINAWEILNSLLFFQDDETRNKLMVEFSDLLTPISLF